MGNFSNHSGVTKDRLTGVKFPFGA